MVTEQTRNYLIIGSIITLLFMFTQGTTSMAVESSGWDALGQNFLQTIQDLLLAIVSNKFVIGALVFIIVGVIIFGSKK